jgi:hypothetical protein
MAVKATSIEQWLKFWKEQKQNHLAVDAAYIYVPWFRTAVNRIASAVQGVPFGVYRGGERVAQEDDFIEVGVFGDVELHLRGLFNGLGANLQMYGRGHYQLRETVLGGGRVELVGAKLIDYRRDANWNITHVEYRRGGYWEVHPIGAGLMDENDGGDYGMPHVWLISRVRDGEPDSAPGLAALKAAGMLDSMAEFGKNAMDAGGAGPTLVTVENFGVMPPAEQEKTRSWFQRMWKLTEAFKPLVMDKKFEVNRLGWSPDEISFAELSREKREDIAAAFDIPMSILMGNAANYATAQIDLLNFYEFKVIPLWGLIADQVNPQLHDAFGVELRPEPNRLDVYQEAEARKSRHYLAWVDRGVIGVNEARRFMMLPDRDEVVDDIFFSPAAQAEDLPTPAGSETVDSTVEPGGGSDASDLKAVGLDDGNTVEGEFREVSEADAALILWERKAVKRFKEGSPEKAVEFEDEALSWGVRSAIIGGLSGAKCVDDVRGVFELAAAADWVGYP